MVNMIILTYKNKYFIEITNADITLHIMTNYT